MASPAEMTITTRTASKFCTKGRALQPPIFFLELISWVTTGITEPWSECQPKEPRSINMLLDANGCRGVVQGGAGGGEDLGF